MANRTLNFNVTRYEHKGREFVRLVVYSNNSDHVQSITMTSADAKQLLKQLHYLRNTGLLKEE